MAEQPIDRSPDIRLVHLLSDGSKTSQHCPGSVDVIDSPSAVPASLGLLLPLEERDSALSHGVGRVSTEVSQHLDHPSGQIRRGRIEQRLMVGEWVLVQEPLIVILVICGPATIT